MRLYLLELPIAFEACQSFNFLSLLNAIITGLLKKQWGPGSARSPGSHLASSAPPLPFSRPGRGVEGDQPCREPRWGQPSASVWQVKGRRRRRRMWRKRQGRMAAALPIFTCNWCSLLRDYMLYIDAENILCNADSIYLTCLHWLAFICSWRSGGLQNIRYHSLFKGWSVWNREDGLIFHLALKVTELITLQCTPSSSLTYLNIVYIQCTIALHTQNTLSA